MATVALVSNKPQDLQGEIRRRPEGSVVQTWGRLGPDKLTFP